MPRTRILCVGEGDLTFSLALARAYGTEQLHITATTLLQSRDELIGTYNNSEAVLEELDRLGVETAFGIDATQLHTTKLQNKMFDWILFSHPHLGLASIQDDEAWHAERHFRLLAHYFWSAGKFGDAKIHVCLCGHQPDTWRLMDAATGLELVGKYGTAAPLSFWLVPPDCEELQVQPHYPAPRRYRNGKLGSKHYLGKFGYRHQLTHPLASNKCPNVEYSQHYVFQRSKNTALAAETNETGGPPFTCNVCGATFVSSDDLLVHLSAPALPNFSGNNTDTRVTSEYSVINSCARTSESALTLSGAASVYTVSSVDSGKRLRRFLQISMSFSKNQAEQHIKNNCVSLNQVLVRDSSRIIHTGDVIEIHGGGNSNSQLINVIYRQDDWVAVVKPVGMRTLGSFSESTLESTVSHQLRDTYTSLSILDTGCAGLCILRKTNLSSHTPLSLQHVFTALVHGRVTWKEFKSDLDSGSCRRWRRRKVLHNVSGGTCESKLHDESPMVQAETSVRMTCNEQTCGQVIPLSTLTITTTSNVRVDALCFMLRKLGHPVVNDRFCRAEYLELPRSVRNLIKSRLCIACFEVSVGSQTIKIETPDRLSSNYWQQHVLNKPNNADVM